MGFFLYFANSFLKKEKYGVPKEGEEKKEKYFVRESQLNTVLSFCLKFKTKNKQTSCHLKVINIFKLGKDLHKDQITSWSLLEVIIPC